MRVAFTPSSPAGQNGMTALLDMFMARSPGVPDQLRARHPCVHHRDLTGLATGTTVDVLAVIRFTSYDFFQGGLRARPDERMAGADVTNDPSYPGLIAAFQQGEETYGVPTDFSTVSMINDPTLFVVPPDTSTGIGGSSEAGSPVADPAASDGLAVSTSSDEPRTVAT